MNRVDLSIDNSLTFTGLQTNRPSARFASYTQRSDPKLNSESEQFKRGIQYLQKASRHSSSVADRQPERLPKVGKGTLVQLELHGVSAKHSSSQNPPQQKSVSVLAEHPIDEGREPAGYGKQEPLLTVFTRLIHCNCNGRGSVGGDHVESSPK